MGKNFVYSIFVITFATVHKDDKYIYHLQINAINIYHNMNAIKRRLLEFIDFKGISKREFCRNIDASNTFLANQSDMAAEKVVKIITVYPEINLNWLLMGAGNMLVNINSDHIRGMAENYANDVVVISKMGNRPSENKEHDGAGSARLWALVKSQRAQLEAKDQQIEAKDLQIASKDRLLETQMRVIEMLTQKGQR